MKRLLSGLLAVAAVALPAAANATPVTLSGGSTFPQIAGPTTSGSTTTVTFGDNSVSGGFSEFLNFFTDGSPVKISGSSSSDGVVFTNATLTGGGSSYGVCSGAITTDCFVLGAIGDTFHFGTSNALSLAANIPYTFTLTGNAPQGGAVTGNLSVNSGVPEPGTWGLMLLGFGGIGFSLRRKRSVPKLLQLA